jgi:methionyl-tRNA formyltransferase
MAKAVRSLWAGTASPRQQSDEESSYYPWPAAEDFRISVARPARWAFNFIRGVAHWSVPFEVVVAGQHLLIRDAVDYTPDVLSTPIVRRHDHVWVQCTPGILHARL